MYIQRSVDKELKLSILRNADTAKLMADTFRVVAESQEDTVSTEPSSTHTMQSIEQILLFIFRCSPSTPRRRFYTRRASVSFHITEAVRPVVMDVRGNAHALKSGRLRTFCRLPDDSPIQADTAMTSAMMPIRTFRPFDLPMHRSAFLMMYIEKFSAFASLSVLYHAALKTD